MGSPREDQKNELPSIENPNLSIDNDVQINPILPDLESLRISYRDIQSRSISTEETLQNLRMRNQDLSKTLEETSKEQDEFQIRNLETETSSKNEEEVFLKETIELEISRARVSEILEQKSQKDRSLPEILGLMRSMKKGLLRISEIIGKEKLDVNLDEKAITEDEFETLVSETGLIHEISLNLESKLVEHDEMRRKEKNELENSIVSLTEENRDINSLLRIALMEKESVEKSVGKTKGIGEQTKVNILQIAERGLQKVGFGFMMGMMAGEVQSDQQSSVSVSSKSGRTECEEEVVGLASAVEKILKNLRHEINDLRRSLDESRSDCERLQILVDEQAQKINESRLCIKYLQDRERVLAQKVEELMVEITEAGEEVVGWREACELEVEVGKAEIEEREREVAMLQDELERTKSALEMANNKLILKERLAATAMAAQEAAEASLQLADSRCAGLQEQIEELTRQVEGDTDHSRKERNSSYHQRVRQACWPWRALKFTPTSHAGGGRAASRGEQRSKRRLPEMQALLHLVI